MVAIKGLEIPKGCQHCKFFIKHILGNGLDYSYSCELGATEFPMPWIRQIEKRASDCPLVEIEERKVGKWVTNPNKMKGAEIECNKCGFSALSNIGIQVCSNFCPNCGADMRGN